MTSADSPDTLMSPRKPSTCTIVGALVLASLSRMYRQRRVAGRRLRGESSGLPEAEPQRAAGVVDLKQRMDEVLEGTKHRSIEVSICVH